MTLAFAVKRPIVCIQGLGFVGLAMSTAIAAASDQDGKPRFNVVGVDLPSPTGLSKVASINDGRLPLSTNDNDLKSAFALAVARGNLTATTDPTVYRAADVIVVDIHLSMDGFGDTTAATNFSDFRDAIRTLGDYARPGTLVLVETTVPPGTCEKVVVPEMANAMRRRRLPEDSVLVAHSYERVMPGRDYLNSIVNYWRVYAGTSPKAAAAAENFLSCIINVEKYPLTRLHSTTASETAKLLENSYRAVNIAFIEEWARFAEQAGIDLFAVIDAIRVRPTHANIRQPGFGVGGYCLTKDPMFAAIGARDLLGLEGLDFPFCREALRVNAAMPLVTLAYVKRMLGGSLKGCAIALMGVSYRQDVSDTRHSPSETFLKAAREEGATVVPHDPLVRDWPEVGLRLSQELPIAEGIDAVVFAVPHKEYQELDVVRWMGDFRPIIFDANRVFTDDQLEWLKMHRFNVGSIGRGC